MTLRLLFVTTGLGTGGAERMLVKLLAALDRTRCQCLVVSLDDAGTQGKAIREMGIPVHELHLKSLGGFVTFTWRLYRITRDFEPNVIQGWMYHGNLAATWVWLAAGRTARLFWGVRQTFHGMSEERPLTRFVIRVGAVLSQVPTMIVFNSRASAVQHGAIGYCLEKAAVIPNGFDLACFHQNHKARSRARAELNIAATTPVIGLVARDHPMKDLATFLRAAALVAQDRSDAIFILAGSGMDLSNERIVSQVRELGLAHAVRLLGEIDKTEALYPALDVFALSSSSEAFPNVLGEAMACGVPCVSTDVGDVRGIIGDTGRVVPVASPSELAREIVALLNLTEGDRRLLGNRAHERVRRLYSLEAVASTYWTCYSTGRIEASIRVGTNVQGAEG